MGFFSCLTGSAVNALGIILGGFLGWMFGKRLSKRVADTLMVALGIAVTYIGITGCLQGQRTLVVILSLVIGAVIGELLRLDKLVDGMGVAVESALSKGGKTIPVAQGMVSATLLFCVGAMAVVGSLNSGLNGDHTTLYAKSCLDMISAAVMASTLGYGVCLSAVPVFILQGGIALLAHWLAPLFSESVIADVTCVGSLVIVLLSLNLIGLSRFKVVNFVPAIFLPLLLCPAYDWVVAQLSALV